VSKINVSLALFAQGHIEEAEKLQREALTSEIRRQGPDHPNSMEMQTYLAATLNAEGRYAEAEKLARQTYEAEREWILGECIHLPSHRHREHLPRQRRRKPAQRIARVLSMAKQSQCGRKLHCFRSGR